MLVAGQAMFLLVPNESKKPPLVPGKVIEGSSTSFTIQLDEPKELAVGLETLAYCEVRGKFFQQGAVLVEIQAEQPKPAYVFSRVGEPVSAEQRQTFRVSVALSNILAKVENQSNCQVVDFSPEGLAVISSPGLTMGTLVKVSLTHADNILSTKARVQTVKILPSGKVRYGLLIPSSDVTARKTLLKMTMAAQRTQLKRIAGAA